MKATKMRTFCLLSLLLFLFSPFYSWSQNMNPNGEGGDIKNKVSCLPEEARAEIQAQIDENRSQLNLNIPIDQRDPQVTDLIFPLRMPNPLPGYFNYYGVSGYVDHDPTAGVQDYNCLRQSYDGHRGTDFFTYPFQWHLYENDLVEVIAASAGTIVFKQDGNIDTNCSPMGSWNAVYVQHPDGSVMWYGHLKRGSLTSKGIGESVAQGEYLGVVASSGYSTDAHLHIEYYDANNRLQDPYQGSCNNLNPSSLWASQPDHRNPKLNAILTHSVAPNIDCGPTNEIAGLANSFQPGDDVYVGIYITDYVQNSLALTNIHRPDNSIYASFNSFNNQFSFDWFWNSRRYTLTDSDPQGTWRVETSYQGVTNAHTFEFGNTVSVSNLDRITFDLYPNPAQNRLWIKTDKVFDRQDYQIINTIGQVVQEGQLIQNELSVEALESGLYFLQIMEDGEVLGKHKFLRY